ncbi:hypothetical protein BSMD_033390 [Bacillus subtilis Miyagi-4]|nr:hypothetical protein BSNT_08341 [Bacillus subtilis subsp. natto BEST195]GAK81423.1 hypothetical protein BSMD_033390 [Bacillus subtilis Miyagi-4]
MLSLAFVLINSYPFCFSESVLNSLFLLFLFHLTIPYHLNFIN